MHFAIAIALPLAANALVIPTPPAAVTDAASSPQTIPSPARSMFEKMIESAESVKHEANVKIASITSEGVSSMTSYMQQVTGTATNAVEGLTQTVAPAASPKHKKASGKTAAPSSTTTDIPLEAKVIYNDFKNKASSIHSQAESKISTLKTEAASSVNSAVTSTPTEKDNTLVRQLLFSNMFAVAHDEHKNKKHHKSPHKGAAIAENTQGAAESTAEPSSTATQRPDVTPDVTSSDASKSTLSTREEEKSKGKKHFNFHHKSAATSAKDQQPSITETQSEPEATSAVTSAESSPEPTLSGRNIDKPQKYHRKPEPTARPTESGFKISQYYDATTTTTSSPTQAYTQDNYPSDVVLAQLLASPHRFVEARKLGHDKIKTARDEPVSADTTSEAESQATQTSEPSQTIDASSSPETSDATPSPTRKHGKHGKATTKSSGNDVAETGDAKPSKGKHIKQTKAAQMLADEMHQAMAQIEPNVF